MPLSERDKRALLFMVVGIGVIGMVFYGGPLLNSVTAGSEEFTQKKARFTSINLKMKHYEDWRQEIEKRQEDLHVKVNPHSEDRQIDEFTKAMEDLGKRSKVQITSWRPMQRKLLRSSSKSKRVAKQTLLFDCTGEFTNLISFVRAIEGMTMPMVIEQISLSKKMVKDKLMISATLRLDLYLFPEAV